MSPGTPPHPPTLALPGPHPSPGSASSASSSPRGRRRPVVLGPTAGPPPLAGALLAPARSVVRWRRQRPLRPPRTGSGGDAAAAGPSGSGRASSHFRGGATASEEVAPEEVAPEEVAAAAAATAGAPGAPFLAVGQVRTPDPGPQPPSARLPTGSPRPNSTLLSFFAWGRVLPAAALESPQSPWPWARQSA
ncbi:transcription initiation factor TFIID subunit 4 [Equus przewalskii]|uniref:Transcription initiation factor TFIID subunit 4 n=1 Tax=Equus przewalskii TaxID=9798 RepID=A0ABM4KII6_EQUPR